MTDHPYPELIFLSYSTSHNGTRTVAELKTLHHLSLHERSARIAEFLNDVLLDPSGSVAVISCYAGKLKVVVMSGGNYQRDFDISCVFLFCLFRSTQNEWVHSVIIGYESLIS
jgi:DNA damage-binding protein 1